jgi:hypothetical protein
VEPTVSSDDRIGSLETAAVHDFPAKHRETLVAELSGWIRLRSVAGVPEHVIDVRRSANWLAGTLRDTGSPSVEVWDTEGGPAGYAQWCAAPGAPTVLIYRDHDVRAAKDDNWDQTPPFEPALRDAYLYGRGTSPWPARSVSSRARTGTSGGATVLDSSTPCVRPPRPGLPSSPSTVC